MSLGSNIRYFWNKSSAWTLSADDLALVFAAVDAPLSTRRRTSSAPPAIAQEHLTNVPAMRYPLKVEYCHHGAQPPVYLAGSWTSPPWEPTKMDIAEEKSKDGNLIFYKQFDAVEEGRYQYKFRLGDGDWWVTDDTASMATDESGNMNNVLVVDAAGQREKVNGDTMDPAAAPEKSSSDPDADQGTSIESKPIPFTVVETVPDQEQPIYGDIEGRPLEEDVSKRATDAQPDAQYEMPAIDEPTVSETAVQPSQPPLSQPVPTLVVEKVDNAPTHGDDMGSEATAGQKLAHELRKADAEPDKVVVSTETTPQDVSGEKPSSHLAHEASEEDDEDEPAPLLPHEKAGPQDDEVPLLPHERTDDHDVDEPVPLLSHECISDDDDDEQGAPLLPHERVTREDDDVIIRVPTIERRGEGAPMFSYEGPEKDPLSGFSPISRNKSNTSLRSVGSTHSMRSLRDIQDEEDVNDPSIEPFPTDREGIYAHIRKTETRLPEDDSIVDDFVTSPNRAEYSQSPALSHNASSVALHSPLVPITEDDADIEEEDGETPMELPSPVTPAMKRTPSSTGESEGLVMSGTDATAGAKSSSVTEEDQLLAAPPTPQMTPQNKDKDTSDAISSKSTPGEKIVTDSDKFKQHSRSSSGLSSAASSTALNVDGRKDSSTTETNPKTSNAVSAPPRNTSLVQAVWHAVFGRWFGSLTQWLIGLFSGKPKAK